MSKSLKQCCCTLAQIGQTDSQIASLTPSTDFQSSGDTTTHHHGNTRTKLKDSQTDNVPAFVTSSTKSDTAAPKQDTSQPQGKKTFFICRYCGKCTLKDYFSKKGCFSSVQQESPDKDVPFPYLDVSGLTKDDRIDLEYALQADTQDIIESFACFMSDIEDSLEKSPVPLSKIKNFILNLQAFTNNQAVKTLDEKDRLKIEKAPTLSDVFMILCKYVSFFNYHIIESILKKHGSAKDHERLQDYLKLFNNFSNRSIFEVPQHIFSSDSTSRSTAKVLVFKLTEAGMDKIEEIKGVIGKIAMLFELQPSALQLCSIKKGCVELHFLISAAVADRIFPVSPSQHSALSEIGVRVLSCEGVEQTSREETK